MPSHIQSVDPPRRSRLTCSNYCFRVAAWNTAFWAPCLWWSAAAGFFWLHTGGMVGRGLVIGLTCWSGFFIGFVGSVAGTLQSRRKLLIGRLEPSPAEWEAIERAPARDLAGAVWKEALLIGCFLLIVLGSLAVLGGFLREGGGATRPVYMFLTFLLPTIALTPVVNRAAWKSLRRFVGATERANPIVIPLRRYVMLHNVLPYAIFNAVSGLVIAFVRFHENYTKGIPIRIESLSLHLAVTAGVIALFVVAAARFKTRVDFLSPIVLVGKSLNATRTKWRIAYAFLIPFFTYGGLRLTFSVVGVEDLGTWSAVSIKVGLCLAISVSTAYWAVTSVLGQLESAGLAGHPYVRLHRFLRHSGLLWSNSETERARSNNRPGPFG